MVEVVETPIRVTLAHVSTLGMDPTVNLTLIRVQTNVQMVLVQIPAIQNLNVHVILDTNCLMVRLTVPTLMSVNPTIIVIPTHCVQILLDHIRATATMGTRVTARTAKTLMNA